MIDFEFERDWQNALRKMKKVFGGDIDLQAALFIIGVQELGKGKQKFSKDQKLDILHIAVCRLLSAYGYYEYLGTDKEGWPHYKRNEKLPFLNPDEQEKLIKQAMIKYMDEQ